MGKWERCDPQIAMRAKEITNLVFSDLTPHERGSYSITRAIRSLAGLEDGNHRNTDNLCLEHEFSKVIADRLQRPTQPNGIYIPMQLNYDQPQFRAAGLDTKTAGAGGYMVTSAVQDVITLLRNKARVLQAGATLLSGLSSDISFPVQLTGSNGSWVAENPGSDVSASDATFGARTLTPKMYSAYTSFSRKLLMQSSTDVEGFVRNDLSEAHAVAVDAAAINGSGDSNQPLGLLGTTNVGSVTFGSGSGGPPTYAKLLDIETNISNANADSDTMSWMVSPTMRGKLRKLPLLDQSTYGGMPVWENVPGAPGQGTLLGYRAWVSNQIPQNLVAGGTTTCQAMILGSWPSLLIGSWGILELLVDPYELKRQGLISVCSYQMVDVAVRYPAQFCASQDATLT